MFTTIVIAPLYNALVYLLNFSPNHEMWIALVIITIIFKIILIPLFKKQVRDQIVMNHLNPKMKEIQEKYKDHKEALAKESMELYKKYKVNPFMSILILIIQLPFIIGLYKIFYHDITYYQHVLYAGLTLPADVNYLFLTVDLTKKSIVLAFFAAVSQYILGSYMFKNKPTGDKSKETEIMQAMNLQMKYFLPVMIGAVSYFTPAVIALYLIVTNIFGIVQEIIIKKPLEKKIQKELA
jgi:YidC/Oxa1 family membrane protein insertase